MSEATEAARDVSVLTKMSISTMKCQPVQAKLLERDVPLARIMGAARGIKVTEGKGGDATYALTGNFFGRNIQSGEDYQSAVLYLPGGVQELILGPLDDALSGTPGQPADPNAVVTFAFDIYSFPAPNPAGYSYRAVDIAAAKRINPIQGLMDEISATRALPSPVTAIEHKK